MEIALIGLLPRVCPHESGGPSLPCEGRRRGRKIGGLIHHVDDSRFTSRRKVLTGGSDQILIFHVYNSPTFNTLSHAILAFLNAGER